MAYVYQLKDGRYVVQYHVGGGKYKREYFGRGLDGEKLAGVRVEELGAGAKRSGWRSAGKTFDMLLEAYLTASRSRMEESTLDRLAIKMEKIILPEIGGLDIRRLTPHRMDQYTNKRLRGSKDRPGVKRVTVNSEVTYIQAVLNWAVGRQYIRLNPLAGYVKPKRDDAVIQPATSEEAQAIMQNSPPHLLRALALSYYTGLRPGLKELLRLVWSDIDWKLKLILVRSAMKGGPRARMVPLHDDFIPLLAGWREDDQANKKLKHDYIIHWHGKPISSIKKAFASAKKKAGITRRLPPYAFRHSFVTTILAAGGDLKATSEIAGHSRPDTTTRIYQHVDLDQYRRAIEKLPPLDIP